MPIVRFFQKCPRCSGIGVSERKFENSDKSLYSFCCQDCGYLSNDEEAKSLFEDAYTLYLKGLKEQASNAEITIEKEKWEVIMKKLKELYHEKEELDNENHHLWTDNEVLREKLRISIDALNFYGNHEHWSKGQDKGCDDRFVALCKGWVKAEECLKEIKG